MCEAKVREVEQHTITIFLALLKDGSAETKTKNNKTIITGREIIIGYYGQNINKIAPEMMTSQLIRRSHALAPAMT
jgi:hypothetical protein